MFKKGSLNIILNKLVDISSYRVPLEMNKFVDLFQKTNPRLLHFHELCSNFLINYR